MAVKKWLGGTTGSTGDLAVASNYAPTGVPVAGDDLYIEANPSGTNYSITTNLTTFQNIALNSINISQTYTQAVIGVANTGTSSTTTGYMSIGGTNSSAITVNIGYNYGTSAAAGSNLIRLNLGSMLATINITNTAASSAMNNAGPVTILGTNTGNTLNILSGIVSVAADPTETSTLKLVNNSGQLSLGSGVTLTSSTINQSTGVCLVRSSVAVINQQLGTINTAGTGSITTFNLQGGAAYLNSTGTITSLNIYSATANFNANPAARTVTTITMYAGATLNLNNGVKNSITITNPIVTAAPSSAITINGWFGSSYTLS